MGEGDQEATRLRVAVITTHDRPEDYADCVTSIVPQVDMLVTVAHGMPEYVWEVLATKGRPASLMVVPYEEEVPNISEMWNLGITCAENYAVYGTGSQLSYDVAILNDDVVVPADWFERVTATMRTEGAAAGSGFRSADPRMAGYAFVLDGDKGIRADEQFLWWYGDDDIARQAETLGGVVRVLGADVEHRHPNSTTIGVLAERAKDDRGRYKRKWNLHGV